MPLPSNGPHLAANHTSPAPPPNQTADTATGCEAGDHNVRNHTMEENATIDHQELLHVAHLVATGYTVLVVGDTRDTGNALLHRLGTLVPGGRVNVAYGRERVRHPSGGRAVLVTPRRLARVRGMRADHVLTNDDGPLPTDVVLALTHAGRASRNHVTVIR